MNRYVFRRWVDVLLMAMIAVIAFWPSSKSTQWLAIDFYFAPGREYVRLAIVVFVSALLLLPIVQFTRCSWRQVRLIHLYPPYWISSVLYVIILCGVQFLSGTSGKYEYVEWAFGLVALLSCTMLAYAYSSMFEVDPIGWAPNRVE
jgi:hypothetical protein